MRPLKPNTHRRRRRNSAVELSCVGGVNASVVSRDPVYNSAAYMWLAQKIGNWVTTDDWCVHTADTTQLDSWVASASAVCIGLKGSH